MTVALDEHWEYGDPAASEAAFRKLLEGAQGDDRLEILTQLARTWSLRKRFDEAHRLLDEVEAQLARAGARVRLRYLLERGRSFNSAGERDRARPLFIEAWHAGLDAGEEGLAVDAAHMVAITHAGTAQGVEWNARALAVARRSAAPKARALIPAMLNNSAWDLVDLGRLDEALQRFEEALAAWTAVGKPGPVRVARWSVAHALRLLGRHDDALATLQALERESAAPERSVLDEIAANLEALGRAEEARSYRGSARAAS